MNAAEIAAFIGALAWLPQIFKWIHGLLVRPLVRIFPDQAATLGFSSAGPVFSLRLDFSAEKVPIVIEQLQLTVRHDDGETHAFRWLSMEELLHEIREPGKAPSIVGRQQTPIALKVLNVDLVEKRIHFNEPKFVSNQRDTHKKLDGHLEYLLTSGGAEKLSKGLDSKELYDLIEGLKNGFWWRPGHYEIEVVVMSSQKFRLKRRLFSFDLTKSDVDRIRENVTKVEQDWRTYVRNRLMGEKTPFCSTWNWANVNILKTT